MRTTKHILQIVTFKVIFYRTLLRFDKFDISTTVEILVAKHISVFSSCELTGRLLKSTKGISCVENDT